MKKIDPEKHAVMIPCSQENFVNFISGLLGKPQTIDRLHSSPFEITRQDIDNLYHLLDQRITQQNEATLIQFTARIIYNDSSSVLLNSYDDFKTYNEVRPLISMGVHLCWTYLIKFQDRPIPEKQQIDITFSAGTGGTILRTDSELPIIETLPWTGRGFIVTRVSHTARTWGVDIDSLLEGQIKTFRRSQSNFRKWLTRNNGKIGIISAVVFLFVTMSFVYYFSNVFLKRQILNLHSFLSSDTVIPDLSHKIDFLLKLATEGTWSRFSFSITVFVVFLIITSIIFAIFIIITADNRLRSFVTITEKSKERKSRLLSKEKRRWFSFIGTLLGGISIGIVSNYFFYIILKKWLE